MKHYGKFIFALFFIFVLSSMKTNSAQLDLSSGQTWGVTRTRVQHNFDEVYTAIENTYIAALIGGNISGSLITSGTVDDSYIDTNIPRLDGTHSITGTYSFPETAYSVSVWDALSTPVTKNSFRDYMFNFDADGDGSFLDESWFPTVNTFNPATPGAIGGTTPAAGAFTTITAGEYNSSATDGERGIVFPENTTKSPGAGLEEVYNEAGVMKYSEGGVEKNFVTIDDTGGDGDTTVTLSADKIVELIMSGGSGVQDGTSTDDILSWDGDSWEPIALTAHPAFSSLLTAFNNAGLNSFTFTPSVTYPIWAATSPVAVSFDVTDTSTTYAVADVDYQYDGSGGFIENMTNTAGNTWTADVTIATDGAHTIQLEVVDDKSTPNSGQSAVYTINFDATDPAIGIVTPSALTHDGLGATLTATVASVTESNESSREWSLYDVTDAAVEIDWSVFTGLSIATVLIPADQHTYRVDVRCTDLAGNVGTESSANIEYAGGASSLTTFIAGSENNGAALSTGTGTLTVTSMTHGVDHNSVTDGAFVNTAGYAQIQTSGNIDYAVGKISFWVYPTETQTNERNRYLFCDGTDYHTFSVSHSADDTLRFRTTGGSAYFTAVTSTTLLTQNTWHFVELTWSDVTDQVVLTIDNGTPTTQSLSFTGPTEGTNFRLFSNDGNNAPYLGRFDTISIFSTTTEE